MKKILLIGANILAALILVRFTVSKFAAWPVSVAGFVDMAKPLGIDPTLFRISTGFIIGFAALSFFINVLLIALKKSETRLRLLAFNIVYAIGAMTGALFSEFFLRSSVKWPLVAIAVAVIALSITNFVVHRGPILRSLRSRSSAADDHTELGDPTV